MKKNILSIFIFLATLEILLRLNGFFDLAYQSYQNHKNVSLRTCVHHHVHR